MVRNSPEMRGNDFWAEMLDVFLVYLEYPIDIRPPSTTIKKEIKPLEDESVEIVLYSPLSPLAEDILLGKVGDMKRPHGITQRSDKNISLHTPWGEGRVSMMRTGRSGYCNLIRFQT